MGQKSDFAEAVNRHSLTGIVADRHSMSPGLVTLKTCYEPGAEKYV